MKIILFTHPSFLKHQSMPRFAQMIVAGMQERGHEVVAWSPAALFFKLALNKPSLQKWFGYIDQFIVFPIVVKLRLLGCSKDTLFVFADQALGPWVPLVKHRPHLVHCHDFLAQQSALGLLQESKTSRTGQYYQKFIRWGYSQANTFVSISKKTQTDLHAMLGKTPKRSEVVYNGLNQNFEPALDVATVRTHLSAQFAVDLSQGFVLHVGGNSFYKNRLGVLEIYDQWRQESKATIPLVMVGFAPTEALLAFKAQAAFSAHIHFIAGVGDLDLQAFYQAATVMVFPSLYEGFGWPIVEAMAAGSLVITTNQDPMQEVAGEAGFYIDKKPLHSQEIITWKKAAAQVLEHIVQLPEEPRAQAVQKSIERAKQFSAPIFLDSIEVIYKQIVQNNK